MKFCKVIHISQKIPSKFLSYHFSKIIQFNLKIFNTFFDLIKQFVPKIYLPSRLGL